ncbi:MAG: family deacetylase [Chitinophagaceae bacterium]|nr:family deacetylase [Chitinophagaceae bacterium]
MIVVAHPDDEILGLGAAMHSIISNYQVQTHVVILGEGITSRSDSRDVAKWNKELAIHKGNIKAAQTAIGYHSVNTYDFPDNRFDSIALLDIIKVIEREKEQFRPEIIFTHHGGDLNVDHQKTFEAVITSCRPVSSESVNMIITFETPSGTEWRASSDPKHFVPNLFIRVTAEDINAKILAMEAYQFEKRIYPHPRSPEALRILAQRWGIAVGAEYSEAFCLIRGIINK